MSKIDANGLKELVAWIKQQQLTSLPGRNEPNWQQLSIFPDFKKLDLAKKLTDMRVELDLSNCCFENVDLSNCNFGMINLSGCKFKGTTKLSFAVFGNGNKTVSQIQLDKNVIVDDKFNVTTSTYKNLGCPKEVNKLRTHWNTKCITNFFALNSNKSEQSKQFEQKEWPKIVSFMSAKELLKSSGSDANFNSESISNVSTQVIVDENSIIPSLGVDKQQVIGLDIINASLENVVKGSIEYRRYEGEMDMLKSAGSDNSNSGCSTPKVVDDGNSEYEFIITDEESNRATDVLGMAKKKVLKETDNDVIEIDNPELVLKNTQVTQLMAHFKRGREDNSYTGDSKKLHSQQSGALSEDIKETVIKTRRTSSFVFRHRDINSFFSASQPMFNDQERSRSIQLEAII